MRRPLKKKNTVAPDPRYKSVRVAKLINYVMERGKKDTARKVVYAAFEEMKKEGDPVAIFEEALQNVQPALEVRSRRVGGANYQVPVPVRPERQLALALRWIVQTAEATKGIPMGTQLAKEILQARNNEGAAIAKKDNMHKMAEANKAFAHFAW